MAASVESSRGKAEAPGKGPRARHQRSGSRRRSNPELTRKYLALKKKHSELEKMFLGSTIGLLVLCFILGGWAFNATQNHRKALHGRYLESEALGKSNSELEATRAELAALVEQRIPSLRVFEADRVIPIAESYVRNLAFTLTRKEGVPIYEYKVVVHNDTDIMARPEITILMFDRLGIEIGRSEVPTRPSDGPVVDFTLYPGESESYASGIALGPNVEPAYFKLEID